MTLIVGEESTLGQWFWWLVAAGKRRPQDGVAGWCLAGAMTTWETHPVTEDRFDDFADVINPTRRETHCWCLSHRLRAPEITELSDGGTRADGVLSRDDGAVRANDRDREQRDDMPCAA